MGRRGPRAGHGGRLPRRPDAVRPARDADAPGRRRLRRGSQLSSRTAGRWSLLPEPPADCDPDDLAEAVAEQLAARWGVVFRDLLARENLAVPWREVLWALRRMEARGTICGGRFVHGFSGEQFAHPDAVGMLREIRKRPRTGETVALSAADPLNLAGIVLPGPRIPAVATNTVTYIDGALADQGAVDQSGSPLSWSLLLPRGAAASSPGGRSGRCSRSGSAPGSPGARARPPRTGRPASPR